jgi:hypothetical protein
LNGGSKVVLKKKLFKHIFCNKIEKNVLKIKNRRGQLMPVAGYPLALHVPATRSWAANWRKQIRPLGKNATKDRQSDTNMRFFYSNSQIYTTVLKFIKTIYQPPWRTAVSRSRHTPRRLYPNRSGPR